MHCAIKSKRSSCLSPVVHEASHDSLRGCPSTHYTTHRSHLQRYGCTRVHVGMMDNDGLRPRFPYHPCLRWAARGGRWCEVKSVATACEGGFFKSIQPVYYTPERSQGVEVH